MAKEKSSIAEKWIDRIDSNSAEKMQEDAVAEVEVGGDWVYIFSDGSSVYEKRRGDWYPAGEYAKCSECDEYFNLDHATSGDGLCEGCVEDRTADKVSD